MRTTRRRFLERSLAATGSVILVPSRATAASLARQSSFPVVEPGTSIEFPRDHAAHPDYRIEWWYLTAWVESDDGPLGLQITFFRVRTGRGEENPSRFAPTQLLLAHAAVTDPEHDSVVYGEMSFRVNGRDTARFSSDAHDLSLGLPNRRWTFERTGDDRYLVEVQDERFAFRFEMVPVGPPVLQGRAGYMQKGPDPREASYYYSRPQGRLTGSVTLDGKERSVEGVGWLDHEWMSQQAPEESVGWDWAGLNLADGGALMFYRIRTADGGTVRAYAQHVPPAAVVGEAEGTIESDSNDIVLTPLSTWISPRTGGEYPVVLRVQTRSLDLVLEPMLVDAEVDTRASTGIIYWEGAVQAWRTGDFENRARAGTEPVAKGYMELTGYAGTVRF